MRAHCEVDMEKLMRESGLEKMYPTSAWPPVPAVRKLKTLLRKAEKDEGIANPVPNSCLRE